MKTPLFVPFLNRPDLLAKAVASATGIDEVEVIVINNSCAPIDAIHFVQSPVVPVFGQPPIPFTFSQTQNWILAQAQARKCPFYLWMHSDARCDPYVIRALVDTAAGSEDKWGVLWTAYDALSAVNTKALQEIGGWDTNLPQYFSDNDTYRRMKLAGYACIDTGLPVVHEASQTINSDPYLKYLNSITFPLYREYYRVKWGGYPGQEIFTHPFGVNPKEWKLGANLVNV